VKECIRKLFTERLEAIQPFRTETGNDDRRKRVLEGGENEAMKNPIAKEKKNKKFF